MYRCILFALSVVALTADSFPVSEVLDGSPASVPGTTSDDCTGCEIVEDLSNLPAGANRTANWGSSETGECVGELPNCVGTGCSIDGIVFVNNNSGPTWYYPVSGNIWNVVQQGNTDRMIIVADLGCGADPITRTYYNAPSLGGTVLGTYSVSCSDCPDGGGGGHGGG